MSQSNSSVRLEASGLSIGYDEKALAENLSFQVKAGEILVLIGPNGAGKSTLLKTIIRQLAPLGGAVLLDGREIAGYHRTELSRKISAVQTIRVSTELQTVRDVVSAGRYPYTGIFGKCAEQDNQKIRQAMEQTDVTSIAERLYSQISDGQRQRVLLARALCQEPKLLILDEPTSFLDIRYKLEFLSLLQQLTRKEQLSVVISMHELDLAQRIADRVISIGADGSCHFSSPEDAFSSDSITSLFRISDGEYDSVTSCAELRKPEGKPKVFVLGGAGYGLPVYRRLQREGIPFAAGILWENDLEYPTAHALAAKLISVPPFAPITDTELAMCRALMADAEQVIYALPAEKMIGVAAPLRQIIGK